ncbi:FkbM family methyltransferase [Hymenobacter gummosus]|uniref:FkbM family methyltransferase n=1 Tax=Hymenobacter gummosus TaxID=1776032 RepID=A0A3S0K516_9BACT|nr:FkbM family methyltransferase [Hymenobacter gummosus]RTQ49317.1 FkbM family methyltransferase [Hymenobacter gummosus]
MKELLKSLLKRLPIAFTKNQQYDEQSLAVIKRVCRPDSTCIDIGCHKGEVLDLMLAAAPQGRHFGFEPLPDLYAELKRRYHDAGRAVISNVALSNSKGTATFNYVISNPAYSGLQKRNYDKPDEQDTTIEVQTDLMDHVIPDTQRVDLIKIDVEGAELQVLQGAVETLRRTRPVIIFEHGLGAADCYGTRPEQVYDLLTEQAGLRVSLMKRWLKGEAPLTRQEFVQQFEQGKNYYFIAYPA